MDFILNFLSNSPEVTAIAVLILASSWITYLVWYRSSVREITTGLYKLTVDVGQDVDGWQGCNERVVQSIKKYPRLAGSWLETQERVTAVPVGGKTTHVMFGLPRDVWNPQTLLGRTFNLSLADAVPNILVGVGLLFTFFFLSVALTETTAVLGGAADAKQTQSAIEALLKVAGAKFLTSLAGLLSSIVWTFYAKREMARLALASEHFLEALGRAVPANGGELIMQQQLNFAGKSHANAEDVLGLTEELLNESREQTGTFKRFETDLAVSLAGAINKAFTPQMEAMTTKLVGAIEGLSEKLGAMNQEALKTMLEDFAAMLKKSTESEMNQLQQTLKELAESLKKAGGSLVDGGVKAGDAINEASALLVARVHEISENLALGAANMETAASAIKSAMSELEATVLEASSIGKRGSLFANEALDKAGNVVSNFAIVTDGLVQASHAIQSVGGKIANVVDTVEELSKEQRAVVLAVKEVAPSALAAVERVTGVLDQAANQTLGVMQQTKQSMESTAATLGKTVASITEGVTVYTDQVAELHRKMDGQFAKAVGSFDKGVSELTESVEELSEVMQRKKGQ
jgi:methyl-accepting chemotaxis protein